MADTLRSRFQNAISRRNGNELARFFSLPLRRSSTEQPIPRHVIDQYQRGIDEKAGNIFKSFSSRLNALESLSQNNCVEALGYCKASYEAAVDYFGNRDENTSWFLPVLRQIADDLRTAAEQADKFTGDLEHKYLRETEPVLKKGLAALLRDKTPIEDPSSKKIGIMAVTNVIFKLYFALDMFNHVSMTLKSIEQSAADCMTQTHLFPVSDVATFKYYFGRINMFQDKLEEARYNLRFALKCCPADSRKNRQRILASLIPVEMSLGIMPSRVAAEQYGFEEYYAMGEAVRVGDIRTFSSLLYQHQQTFIRVGVYLVLEQVKLIVYRNLFKRVQRILAATKIPLSTIEAATKYLGDEADLDEIECLLANMIFDKKLKGYISHKQRMLVVHPTDAFPSDKIVIKFPTDKIDIYQRK